MNQKNVINKWIGFLLGFIIFPPFPIVQSDPVPIVQNDISVKKVTFSINQDQITIPVPSEKSFAENIIIYNIHRSLLLSLFKEYKIEIPDQLLRDSLDDYFSIAGLNAESFDQIQNKLGDKKGEKEFPSSLKEMKDYSTGGVLFDLMTWKLFYKITQDVTNEEKDDYFNKFWNERLKEAQIILPNDYSSLNFFIPLKKPYLPESILNVLGSE